MPRYRKDDWTFFVRPAKDGTPVYYYRTYDEAGKRTVGRSTGATNLRDANRYVRRLEREGRLVPNKSVGFDVFTEDFWVWGKCEYIARCNTIGPKSVSPDHAMTERGYLVNHVRPYFGKARLEAISPEECEKFLIHLKKNSGLSDGSINHVLKVAKGVFREAVRRKLIKDDPCSQVAYVKAEHKARGILTLEEVRNLLSPDLVGTVWEGDRVDYAFNLLAAVTGVRRGELLSLRVSSVFPNYLDISRSWGIVSGVKDTTKGKKKRIVPIPPIASAILNDIMPQDPEAFVFSKDGGATEYPHVIVLKKLYAAMAKIGITPAQRKARNLTFHSWRHFCNTHLLTRNVAESKIRKAIGHQSVAMTDNYAHLALADLTDVLAAQTEILQEKDHEREAD